MRSDENEPTFSTPPAILNAIAPLIQAFRDDVAGCSSVLDEHLEAYGELIPHVFCFEFVEFLQKNSTGASDGARIVRPAMVAIEGVLTALVGVDPRDDWKEFFETMLWTSFFENFEPIGPEFENVRREFGPLLEAEYQGYMRATRPRRVPACSLVIS